MPFTGDTQRTGQPKQQSQATGISPTEEPTRAIWSTPVASEYSNPYRAPTGCRGQRKWHRHAADVSAEVNLSLPAERYSDSGGISYSFLRLQLSWEWLASAVGGGELCHGVLATRACASSANMRPNLQPASDGQVSGRRRSYFSPEGICACSPTDTQGPTSSSGWSQWEDGECPGLLNCE